MSKRTSHTAHTAIGLIQVFFTGFALPPGLIQGHLHQCEIARAVANVASDRCNKRVALGFVAVTSKDQRPVHDSVKTRIKGCSSSRSGAAIIDRRHQGFETEMW